jgi:hypothetical protein
MSAPAFRSEPEPREHAAPDWLEAARQAFLWRYFYDDGGPLPPTPSAANPGVYRKNRSAFYAAAQRNGMSSVGDQA